MSLAEKSLYQATQQTRLGYWEPAIPPYIDLSAVSPVQEVLSKAAHRVITA